MTEDTLKHLPINTLFDLMVQTTEELMAMNKKENEIAMQNKKKEVQLIQRIIVAKKAEFSPGPSIQYSN